MSFDLSSFDTVVVLWAALAVPVFIYSLVGTDHVGRTGGNPRGPRVAACWGWVVMELPALCLLPAVYFSAGNRHLVADLLVAAWVIHYPIFNTASEYTLIINRLQREKRASGTTNAFKPEIEGPQTIILRTPPGAGSMPRAS